VPSDGTGDRRSRPRTDVDVAVGENPPDSEAPDDDGREDPSRHQNIGPEFRRLDDKPGDDQHHRQQDSQRRDDATHDEAGSVVAQQESLRLSIADQGGLVRGQRRGYKVGGGEGAAPDQRPRQRDQYPCSSNDSRCA